jgi:hypothetical protein
MVRRIGWLAGLLILVTGGIAAMSLTEGQENPSQNVAPPGPNQPAHVAEAPGDSSRLAGALSKLPPLQQQMLLSAQRGADWLRRANRTDGRFVYGYLPDLRTTLLGDHYLRQVEAAFALARVGRYLGDERYVAVARQAILTLLLDTALDGETPQTRHTTLPSLVANRIGSAGLLIAAIHELPTPGEDLLEQAEQLCGYLRQQQAADGSFNLGGTSERAEQEPDAILFCPAQAMVGLLHSYRLRPAAWKVEATTRALGYYRDWWRAHKNMPMIPWLSAAFAQAFLLSNEQAFAGCVNELNDWLCALQYVQLDPSHPLWTGGFMDWADGRAVPAPPSIGSAFYATSLAEACRVARQAGDLPRYQRYREALERCLQYVSTLQYTDANTQHFADWYRLALLGGFHGSQQDGNLRIDFTSHAIRAMVQYLAVVNGEG